MLADFVSPERFTYLPNTAGCFTGEDAVRTLRLAREAGGWSLVKLEVLSDPKHLYPDMEETLRAQKLLVADGFEVMVYCSDDRSTPESWRTPAPPPSCRWAPPSVRGWASRTGSTSA